MSCCDGDEGGPGCTCGYRAAYNALELARRLGQTHRWVRSSRYPGYEQTYIDGYLFTRPTATGSIQNPQPQYGDDGKIIRELILKNTSKSVEAAWKIIQEQDETIRKLREELKQAKSTPKVVPQQSPRCIVINGYSMTVEEYERSSG